MPKPSAPLKILLVEDNPFNLNLARTVLELESHLVTEAINGLEALNLLSHKSFDVILMDVQMPEMDGIAATRHIRHYEQGIVPDAGEHLAPIKKVIERIRGSYTPVVAMTAHAMSGDREKCIEAGMDDYITKPFQAEEVFAVLQRVTESSTGDKA